MLRRYVLDDEDNPVRQDDPQIWKAFMQDGRRRRVAFDEAGKWTVTTLFMGIDHDLVGNGPPVLWKTSVVGPQPWGGFSCWYSSRWKALSQHDQVAEAVRRGQDLPEKPFPIR
ncbi:MAG: hypothetical protein JO057_04150 [Chloroflexi bacterium]|nr:hypothetical protein [Chloroflexota bacterium]